MPFVYLQLVLYEA